MIRGSVTGADQAVIVLRLQGPSEAQVEVRAVIDTGYNGLLTLPVETAAALDLVPARTSWAELANGTVVPLEVADVVIDWGGSPRDVGASIVGPRPLVGMGLLKGHALRIDVVPGGGVEIEPLS